MEKQQMQSKYMDLKKKLAELNYQGDFGTE
jgi:hypothetical protein